jgi:archaellum component FlaC
MKWLEDIRSRLSNVENDIGLIHEDGLDYPRRTAYSIHKHESALEKQAEQLHNITEELNKLKAIVAETCNYVYREKK